MDIIRKISKFAERYFAIIVLAAAAISLYRPETFKWVLPHISLLLGVIMFGMGMTLKPENFKIAFARPGEIILGVTAQFTIMPLLAYMICMLLKLPAELAVGIILLGACPGGTASNVITYLAKGDVAFSVGMTTISTLLAPVLTPVITLTLAHKWVSIAAGNMFLSIFKIVIIPIILGLAANKFLGRKEENISGILPSVSVAAIVLIVGGVVGANSEKLLSTALVVFLAIVLHNCLGLLLGFWIGKLFGIDQSKRRAMSIEVGMQNSGLAVALAMAYFTPLAAIPGALFSVWHNISGPILAAYWSKQNTL